MKQATRLREVALGIKYFADEFKVLVAEMITLQAFYTFESAVEEIACKIVCGAHYVDGVAPVLLHKAATIDDAVTAMRTLNRTKVKAFLKWNQALIITENVEYVMDPGEHFCAVCKSHGNIINEVRRIRNHIAHFNNDTRKQYQQAVAGRLGATPRKLPRPGAFLLREFTTGTPLVVEYVVTLQGIVKAIAKA